jgi:hypothetical protein
LLWSARMGGFCILAMLALACAAGIYDYPQFIWAWPGLIWLSYLSLNTLWR